MHTKAALKIQEASKQKSQVCRLKALEIHGQLCWSKELFDIIQQKIPCSSAYWSYALKNNITSKFYNIRNNSV